MTRRYHARRKPQRLVCISLLLLTGCTSFQPSYYENTSRDGENRVVAQGQAASNAAWVNTSNASLGRGAAMSRSIGGNRSPAGPTDLLTESVQRLYADSLRSATSTLSSVINRSINEALR